MKTYETYNKDNIDIDCEREAKAIYKHNKLSIKPVKSKINRVKPKLTSKTDNLLDM
jgi:hypothetical protein